jgi:hypothetical protein
VRERERERERERGGAMLGLTAACTTACTNITKPEAHRSAYSTVSTPTTDTLLYTGLSSKG